MKIFINDMLTSSKNEFIYNHEFDIDFCEIDGRKVVFNKKPRISARITKRNDGSLLADTNIHLDTTLNCVRCLDEMQAESVINIAGVISNEDIESDYDIILSDDDYLDFEKLLYDAVFELLNDFLYCKEDCKGLCHNCGVNFNHSKCNCEEENPNIDPRLAQLKNFF